MVNTCIRHRVLVIDVTRDVIIGLNLLEGNKINMDLDNGIMRFGDELIMINFSRRPAILKVVSADLISSKLEDGQ